MNPQDFNLVQPTQNTEGAKKNNTKTRINTLNCESVMIY